MSTLKDVAALCGLDVSTVSRALRGDSRVKEETIVRVKEAAGSLHYRPNLAARNLVKGRSRTLALIVSSLDNPLEQQPAQYASAYLQERSYDLMISLTGGKGETFERLLNRLDQNLFDGAVIIPGTPLTGGAEETLRRLHDKGFPLVFLDRWDSPVPFSVVTTDNRTAGRELAESLLDRGCREIVILSDEQNGVERVRVEGEREACLSRGITPQIVTGTDPFVPGSAGKQSLGILCSSWDRVVSLFSQKTEKERELFVGVFDFWAGSVYPAREVIVCRQDFRLMAEEACSLILKSLDTPKGAFPGSGRKMLLPLRELQIVN